jgi:hypothetical protein
MKLPSKGKPINAAMKSSEFGPIRSWLMKRCIRCICFFAWIGAKLAAPE